MLPTPIAYTTIRPRATSRLLAKTYPASDNDQMATIRSFRLLAVVAVLAMLLAVFAPLTTMMEMTSEGGHGITVTSLPSTMDCDACPKGSMAFAGCGQMCCQFAAPIVDDSHVFVTESVRYASVSIRRPAEWHTVPPVSPG